MIVAYGVDSADPAPSVSSLRDARLGFAARYLSPPGNSKNLTAAEAMRLHRGGIDIVTVWESWATRASEGKRAGIDDSKAALALGKECGAPAGFPVFFAVDYDATGQTAQLSGYFQGAISVLGIGRVGLYGGLAAIEFAYGLGIRRLWQTYAWSGGVWHPGASLRQYSNGHTVGGVEVDLDYATAADFGQWLYVAPVVAKPVVKSIIHAIRPPLLGPWTHRPTEIRPGYEVLGPTGGKHLYYERRK